MTWRRRSRRVSTQRVRRRPREQPPPARRMAGERTGARRAAGRLLDGGAPARRAATCRAARRRGPAAAGEQPGGARCGAAPGTAQRARQSAVLRRARPALLRAAERRGLSGARRGVLVWTELPRRHHLQRRALRHVRHDRRAQDPAPAELRARHQPQERQEHRGAHQRPRPFVANRLIDLSYSAAARLDMLREGTTLVEVRALTPGVPDELTRSAAAPAPTLYVQAGAFADEHNAQRLLTRLQAAGLPAVFVAAPLAGSAPLYRVRVGPVASVADFDRIAARLNALGVAQVRLAVE